MSNGYDQYYETEDLFGAPYPELINFFSDHPTRGKALDLGCGQGRDAIAIARLGYTVTGIDNSQVGIAQMIRVAEEEKLPVVGVVDDIYALTNFSDYEFILLDSMLHFTKVDRDKETDLVRRIVMGCNTGTLINFCIQDTGKKVKFLNGAIDFDRRLDRVKEAGFNYVFEDEESGHRSVTSYKMVVIKT